MKSISDHIVSFLSKQKTWVPKFYNKMYHFLILKELGNENFFVVKVSLEAKQYLLLSNMCFQKLNDRK